MVATLLILFLLAHPSHASGGSGGGMGDLQWLDFAAVNQSCPGDQGQGRGGPYKGVHSSGVCDPYMTGKWCADALAIVGHQKCNATRKDREKCRRISEGCMYPLKVLATKSDSRVLPLLHAARPGEIDGCLRRHAEDRPVHFLFVGDSQTRMLEFEFRRWASRGVDIPRYDSIMGMDVNRTGWSAQNVDVTQVVNGCAHDIHSKEEVSGKVLAAVSAMPPRARLVVVAGYGIWDVVFSNCSEKTTLLRMEREYAAMLDAVVTSVLVAGAPRNISTDFYVRNMFVSYKLNGKEFVPYVFRVNDIVGRAFSSQRLKHANNAAISFRFLDVYRFSALRRHEMPYNSDGLHWACIGRLGYQLCHHGLRAPKRPDEVAWAVMQLILLNFCGLFQL